MYTPDKPTFRELMQGLAAVFTPNKPVAEDVIERYFSALIDIPFQTVKRRADSHLRHGKFFPKPFELRPREERHTEETPGQRAGFDHAMRENRANWEAALKADSLSARWLLLEAYLGRTDALHSPEDPMHQDKLDVAREMYATLKRESPDGLISSLPCAWRVVVYLEPKAALNYLPLRVMTPELAL